MAERGLQAIRLYQQGQIDKLKRYCLDDVRLTREVYEHGCRHGPVEKRRTQKNFATS